MSFEIIVFENQSVYNHIIREIEDEKEAIELFYNFCEEYSCYLFGSDEKEERKLTIGNLYVSYADDSGVDKPLNILLLGKLTEESKELIKNWLS